MIKFGPAGFGGVNFAVSNLKKYNSLGIKACEIPFTYGIWIKPEQTKEIKEAAEKFEVQLSIHAPYWINLNSSDKTKIQQSKKRILDCCKIGELLGAKIVVFHAGFFGKLDKEEGYQNIKKAILEIMDEIRKNNWKIKIAPETMGKLNVFGSADDILRLVKETGCSFCVDFAHLWARSRGKMSYEEMYAQFKEFDELHCHFSGIVFGESGEKHHILTPEKEMENLIKALPKAKNITIINESPDPVGDSVEAIKIYNKL
jgi:deoxyribonuclease-4